MKRPEQQLQRAVVNYLRIVLPPDAWSTAINPVPGKTPAVAAISKAMGMRPGCPDLLVCWRGQCLFFELKSSKGSLSPAQRECIAAIKAAGIETHLVRGVPDVADALRAWGVPSRARIAA